jgi:hypothetical protein
MNNVHVCGSKSATMQLLSAQKFKLEKPTLNVKFVGLFDKKNGVKY